MFYKKKSVHHKFDGNAILFRKERFKMKRYFFLNLRLKNGKNYNREDELTKNMTYPSTALFLLLEEKNKIKSSILIINTHLLFDAKRGDIKFGMLILIFKTIYKITQNFAVSDIFFCGDFNFMPNSMLYNFITKSLVDFSCDLKEYSNQIMISKMNNVKDIEIIAKIADRKFKPSPESNKKTIDFGFIKKLCLAEIIIPEDNNKIKIKGRDEQINFDIIKNHLEIISRIHNFKSSYAEFNKKYRKKNKNSNKINNLNFHFDKKRYNNDAFITQFTNDFKNTFDYIWFSPQGNFKLYKILQTPNQNYLKSLFKTCPVDFFGSDHFSLVVDLIRIN